MRLVTIRVADFRSLTNIEVELGDLRCSLAQIMLEKTGLLDAAQFAIGANRRIFGKEDIRLAKDEADVPKERRAVVDILLRPVDGEGKVAETFPEGRLDRLWGTGIAQDDDQATWSECGRS